MRAKLRVLPFVILLLPVDAVVAIAVLLTEVIGLVERGGIRGRRPNSQIRTKEFGLRPRIPLRSATIIVVNWDGRHLLDECLPALLEAVRYDGGAHEILVVDNGSTDGSVDFVRTTFPQVRVLSLNRNYGFTGGNNRGIQEATTDIVVLLNNDMVVDRGFLRPLLDGFQDPSVFAVTSQVFFSDRAQRREETGKTRGRFDRGFFELWHDELAPQEERLATIPVFWAGGGSCAIDRRRYLEIGGFDRLYRPFYVEDTDLSYQAWKRGWTCLLAPSSRVTHKHRGTSRPKFGNRIVDNTIRKNQYLFIWKNVTDFPMIAEHVTNLPRIHARCLLREEAGFELSAYLRAVKQLPEALWKRLRSLPSYELSDREVLTRSHQA